MGYSPHKGTPTQDPSPGIPDPRLSTMRDDPDQDPRDSGPRPVHLRGQPAKLLRTLQGYQPGAEQNTVQTLDLKLEPSLELPFMWAIGSLLLSIWTQRENRRVDLARTRAELEAKCRILRECKLKTWANAHTLTEAILNQLFNV